MKLSIIHLTLGLGLLLAAAGCARPEQVLPPPNLLPREQFTGLLIRFHLLEAQVENSRLSPDSARSLFLSQRHELLWQSGASEADSTFERSYRYYAQHGKDLDEIYAVVIDSLTTREKKMGGNPVPTHP